MNFFFTRQTLVFVMGLWTWGEQVNASNIRCGIHTDSTTAVVYICSGCTALLL